MNVYDGLHWNIYEILPYQRNFNFINGERSIGKTYTALMYVLDKCLEKGLEFIYVVRSQDEKKRGAFQDGLKKVVIREFNDFLFKFTTEDMYRVIEGENGEDEKIQIGYCIALSEAVKVKKRSFPNVKFIIFDEYMLEENSVTQYVNGWKEPDLFLSIYHTIDREEDRVMCFCLGNNTKFHNPYHLHKAFNIQSVNKGEIWTSENVLFQNAKATTSLKEKKSTSKFLRMLNDSTYGKYAVQGDYIYDNYSFMEKMQTTCRYSFTMEYDTLKFGVYSDIKIGLIFISDKVDPSCKLIYALTLKDHKENTLLTEGRQTTHLRWLADNFKLGNVRFTSMEVKTKSEKGIALLL